MSKQEVLLWKKPHDIADHIDRFLQAPEVTHPCRVLALCLDFFYISFCGLFGVWFICVVFWTFLAAIIVVSVSMSPVVVLVPFSAVFVWRISTYARKGMVAPAAVYTVLFLLVFMVVVQLSFLFWPHFRRVDESPCLLLQSLVRHLIPAF